MKILIFRSGAYGDCIILTPIIRHLHEQGHELYVQTGKRGMEVFKNNPHIYRLIEHKEDTPIDKLSENIEWVRKKFGCEKVYDFSESVEVSLSQHPRSPNYKIPKDERIRRFNKNFYEHSFTHAGVELSDNLLPELFFTKPEIEEASCHVDEFKFNVLLGLSGSGRNKTWPWAQDFAYKLCDEFQDVHIITIGDELCRLIEPEREGRITNLCGKISMRQSMALTGLVDLVIAPDTGIIHASGCYETPKICLLGHNTIEGITRHFKNDYSIEADKELAPCAPCLYLVYDMKLQCPLNSFTQSSICMADGISIDGVLERFREVYAKFKKTS